MYALVHTYSYVMFTNTLHSSLDRDGYHTTLYAICHVHVMSPINSCFCTYLCYMYVPTYLHSLYTLMHYTNTAAYIWHMYIYTSCTNASDINGTTYVAGQIAI